MLDPQARLEELDARGLRRRRRLIEPEPGGTRVRVDGRPALLLCSNDYLGLAGDPRVREAAADAALRHGAGSGASALVCGHGAAHAALEARLAAFKGTERALLLGSGYLANIGIVPALARAGEVVFSDALNHASIVDGCRLARAETFVYRHGDLDHLAWGLERAGQRAALVVTDGVFSMDGDLAPLEGIVALARRARARVMVDEAHATGTIGPGGRGSVAAAGLSEEVDVIMGTLGKALGAYGAFAACSAALMDWLVNAARTVIFSTALPPAACAAAGAALSVLEAEPERVARLQANARRLRAALSAAGLPAPKSGTHIMPLVIGDAGQAMATCEAALEEGVFAQGIRPPTVPPGTSRLRLAVMATHTEADLDTAARGLARAWTTAGVPMPEPAGEPVGAA